VQSRCSRREHAAAARDKAAADIEMDREQARATADAQAEHLRDAADEAKGKISDWWNDVQSTALTSTRPVRRHALRFRNRLIASVPAGTCGALVADELQARARSMLRLLLSLRRQRFRNARS
jgi:hypothetical protein